MAEQTKRKKMQKKISMKMIRLAGNAMVYLAIYGLLFFGVVSLCQKGYRFCYEIFGPTVLEESSGEEKAFQVKEEDTMKSVSERLEKEGLIVSHNSFYLCSKLMDSHNQELRPGIYLLRTDMDYGEIIDQLTVSEGITP